MFLGFFCIYFLKTVPCTKSIYLPFKLVLIELRETLYTPFIALTGDAVLIVFIRFIYEKTYSLHGII